MSFANVPGLSSDELRSCDYCGGQLGFTPYRVRVEQHIVDMDAVRSLHGLGMMLGAAAGLATVFSPHSEYTKVFNVHQNILCQDCALKAPWALHSKADGTPGAEEEGGE